MDTANIKHIVKLILADVSGKQYPCINDQHILGRDLEVDSLDMVEIIMDCEKKLDLHISDAEVEFAKKWSVEDFVNYIIKQVEIQH